ncbi:Integral membrane protein [Bibersteinia trehalosi USDA-ARS-USMARC-188]|uniref:Integral membrane protein n=5 Tax=Bibersteinia trehalosi TaxID=47735 RepID=W0R8K4_BIBTR|nr:YggT family protein [Bibersteinia trehalosi]AGH39190.1 Integral membrane protein [Bibersteinia trehalosi USDA-ARS-USMARC-192]AHG81063.1 Integral membrane protein [Bibersteinia trehalosi USDA-ARS-USMARC-188]AHG83274.1 Integral membrane protein [Bibersteinia trehalosi USDA-ARS-USMARC-189]AHG87121.1 Integral membrane protein [Bibersteinia trehalosi USDA-ARS-USMARC-190]OAQ14281.1 membrane protein [Bibersteinia trehalosi Y31]
MEFLAPILALVIGLFNFILILRAWLQYCRVDIRLPISQTILRLTSPIVDPVSKFIPTVRRINFAAIFLAGVIVTIQFLILGIDPMSAGIIGVLSILKTFGQILFYTTLIRALMSWVTQGNHPLDYLIAQITEPVLGIIRKVLPRTGMLDFSVMVLGFGLLLLNNAMLRVFGGLWVLA